MEGVLSNLPSPPNSPTQSNMIYTNIFNPLFPMLIDILDLIDVIVLYHAFVVNGWIMPLL